MIEYFKIIKTYFFFDRIISLRFIFKLFAKKNYARIK